MVREPAEAAARALHLGGDELIGAFFHV